MEIVDKIVDFFVWLCAQEPIVKEEVFEEKEEPNDEQKTALWANYFQISEKVDELLKKLEEETNPVIKSGLRKTIASLKRRMTYSANKLKLL